MVEIRNLLAQRGAFSLRIDNLSLAAGTILCIAGPNGCGKTTLIECLTGLLAPTHGSITVNGVPVSADLRATKALVGFVPDDEQWLIPELCAEEYFRLLQRVYANAGVTHPMHLRTTELAARLYFTAWRQPLGLLSHGNKKKVQLIAALLHQPKLLLVDELRNGLDPLVSIAAEELLRQEVKDGTCIIAATHDLWWAERLAQRTLLLKDGRVAVDDDTRQLVDHHGSLEQLFIQLAGEVIQ